MERFRINTQVIVNLNAFIVHVIYCTVQTQALKERLNRKSRRQAVVILISPLRYRIMFETTWDGTGKNRWVFHSILSNAIHRQAVNEHIRIEIVHERSVKQETSISCVNTVQMFCRIVFPALYQIRDSKRCIEGEFAHAVDTSVKTPVFLCQFLGRLSLASTSGRHGLPSAYRGPLQRPDRTKRHPVCRQTCQNRFSSIYLPSVVHWN